MARPCMVLHLEGEAGPFRRGLHKKGMDAGSRGKKKAKQRPRLQHRREFDIRSAAKKGWSGYYNNRRLQKSPGYWH